MNVLPSSLDLPVVMFTRLSRLEKARLSAVGVGKLGSAAVSLGPIAQSQSPPPGIVVGRPDESGCASRCMTVRTHSGWSS